MDNGASSYRRFLEGDDNGIVEIIRDYKDGFILFLNRYVNNIQIAEELAEDTFFKLVTKKPRFAGNHSFKTWLYTIGRNMAINYTKRAGRAADISSQDLERLCAEESSLESAYLREERKIILHRALAKIQPAYSQVLYLKFFEDLSNGQIAAVIGKTKRQTENLIYQAKQSLKSELNKEGFDYEGL